MGCSTRKVSGRGAGVGMMLQPDLVAETFHLLTKHLSVPITGKIRMGWEEQRNYLEIARIMEDNGAALIALHGRTKEQKYNFEADWDAIAALKQSVSVPVIGNGDVRTPADIDAMKTHTGCDAVMVGRAAVGNPWVFARQERAQLTFHEVAATIRLHLREMVEYYGDPDGLILFRKHLRRYFSGYSVKPLLQKMLVAPDLVVFERLLQETEAFLAGETLVAHQAAQSAFFHCRS
jgi:nifR3 family TIM-barrel protein